MTPPDEGLCIGALADGVAFCLPRDAATQKFAFLARSGAGKSYSASKLAELMQAAGIQFVVLDPVGVWYGLRLAADGQGAGLPIPVFGGEFGDVPLEPTAGALVADLVVERGLSVVLDVSGFRKNQRKQFVTEFAEELFHRKKTARSPLHLFLEEAQSFVPQRTISGEERMLGAFEDIGKIGRNYGIGLSLISQRPQAVHKDVLNQAECLFVLQLNAALERKAIRDWIDAQGIDAGATVDELPTLPIGTAFVWSPQWLKFFGKVRISSKATYNASATPTFDTPAVAPQPLGEADLEALRSAMQAVVKEAEQHDPKAMQAKIAALEKQLAAAAKPKPQQVGFVVVDEHLVRLESVVQDLRSVAQSIQESAKVLAEAISQARPAAKPPVLLEAPPRPTRPTSVPRPTTQLVRSGTKLPAPQQKILDTLAEFITLGVPIVARHNVAVWAGQSPTSSAYTNNLGSLRSKGYIDYPSGGMLTLTPAGHARARPVARRRSRRELHQAWCNRVGPTKARILRVLIDRYPRSIERVMLAHLAGASPTSSAYTNNLGALRSLGLVDYPERKLVVATDLLFPKGLD